LKVAGVEDRVEAAAGEETDLVAVDLLQLETKEVGIQAAKEAEVEVEVEVGMEEAKEAILQQKRL
jgi:hypothetical protein